MDTQALDIARRYDQVPYTSRPFPQSHPQRLAALATLFGLTPPGVATARVLELGCAAGGNLIPTAAAFPQADFIGLDLSPVQIADGQARIARMGLKNIRLINMSIADVTRGFGTFDYIICHGVYSWVPAAVRDAILRVSHDNLSEHGVAYVSYNVFPGWRLRAVLRDAMMFHSEAAKDATEKVARGRDFLDKLGSLTNAGAPYGQMLRHEARLMTGMEDCYVAHEYFEADNEPCYVADFLKRLDIFNLSFLTEADVHLTIAENFGAETGALLRTLSDNRLERMEQYIDFLTGRTFRQSLLVRKEQAPRIQRALNPAALSGLHLSTRVGVEPEERDGRFIFKDAAARTLTTASPAVREAVSRLARMAPLTATPEDLTHHLSRDGDGDPQDAADVVNALFNMVLAGLADISAMPVVTPGDIAERPAAGLVPRSDARDGRTWTTNPRHESVPLNLVQRAILPLLDGTNDRDAIAAEVHAMVTSGQLTFQRDGQNLVEPAHISQAIDEHVASALSEFHRAALLS